MSGVAEALSITASLFTISDYLPEGDNVAPIEEVVVNYGAPVIDLSVGTPPTLERIVTNESKSDRTDFTGASSYQEARVEAW